MLRASAVAERAGVPTASLVCEGFIGQAATTSTGLGLPGLATALVPVVLGTLFLLPVILLYVAWSYWVFRGKVTGAHSHGYHVM